MNEKLAMPDLVVGYREDLRDAIHAMPASRSLGLRVLGFSPAGVSVIEMPLQAQWTFDGTIAQGGIVGALADYAGVSAAAATLERGWMASTTGFEVHNIAPAKGEKLLAIGRALSIGKTTAVSRSDVYAITGDTSGLVAVATTTCRPFLFQNSGRG